MKFHDYLESNYVKTNIDIQLNYHPKLAAKTQAIQSLINGQKQVLKIFAYATILIGYLKVITRMAPEPKTAHEIVKEFNDLKTRPSEIAKPVVQEVEGHGI
jgi:hypothetical protein